MKISDDDNHDHHNDIDKNVNDNNMNMNINIHININNDRQVVRAVDSGWTEAEAAWYLHLVLPLASAGLLCCGLLYHTNL